MVPRITHGSVGDSAALGRIRNSAGQEAPAAGPNAWQEKPGSTKQLAACVRKTFGAGS